MTMCFASGSLAARWFRNNLPRRQLPAAARRAASSRCWLFTSRHVRNSTATASANSGRFRWYRFGISFFASIFRILQSSVKILRLVDIFIFRRMNKRQKSFADKPKY
jgi:hypothetical protein